MNGSQPRPSTGCADCGAPKKSPEYRYCAACGQRHVLGLFFQRYDRRADDGPESGKGAQA